MVNHQEEKEAQYLFEEGYKQKIFGLKRVNKINKKIEVDLHEYNQKGESVGGVETEVAQCYLRYLLNDDLKEKELFILITGQGTQLREGIPRYLETQGYKVTQNRHNTGRYEVELRKKEDGLCVQQTDIIPPNKDNRKKNSTSLKKRKARRRRKNRQKKTVELASSVYKKNRLYIIIGLLMLASISIWWIVNKAKENDTKHQE